MKSFKAEIKRNENVPFVKHHIKKYDRHFPIWVAVELFTLGNIKHLYQNLPGKLRKDISSTFAVSSRVLDSWIENLRITRNSLAHNMRVYGAKYIITPKMPKGAYRAEAAQHRIFDQVYLMMQLYPEEFEWNDIVGDIDTLLMTYKSDIELHAIGFPDDWKKYLIKGKFPLPLKKLA
jgi:abortive infection bacteriophage resistance protein